MLFTCVLRVKFTEVDLCYHNTAATLLRLIKRIKILEFLNKLCIKKGTTVFLKTKGFWMSYTSASTLFICLSSEILLHLTYLSYFTSVVTTITPGLHRRHNYALSHQMSQLSTQVQSLTEDWGSHYDCPQRNRTKDVAIYSKIGNNNQLCIG